MTLEELQAEVLRLQEENADLKTERDTLTATNSELTKEIDEVRATNQRYFNKLTAHYAEPDKGDEEAEETSESWSDFLQNHNIIGGR
jgi:uncharacterized coiled-coil DUF342 family protein